MKCVCGFDSDAQWNDDHYYGPFEEIIAIAGKILCVCPKCGTVRAA
jgi:hypothetical protein